MALDVGVHDGLEVLEFAVLQEVDDVDLQNWNTNTISFNYIYICSVFFILSFLSNQFKKHFCRAFLKRFPGAGVSVYLNLEQTNDPQPSHIVIPAFDVITGFGMKNLLSSVCRLWLSFIH